MVEFLSWMGWPVALIFGAIALREHRRFVLSEFKLNKHREKGKVPRPAEWPINPAGVHAPDEWRG